MIRCCFKVSHIHPTQLSMEVEGGVSVGPLWHVAQPEKLAFIIQACFNLDQCRVSWEGAKTHRGKSHTAAMTTHSSSSSSRDEPTQNEW